jgi:predicted nucleic acid-binding protein
MSLQPRDEVFITTITQAEVLYGVEVLPTGKRRTLLRAAIEKLLATEFSGRIIPFDEHAAIAYANIVCDRERIGRPISQFDAMIASACRSRSATIATRNVEDFLHCGVPIINPWNHKSSVQ